MLHELCWYSGCVVSACLLPQSIWGYSEVVKVVKEVKISRWFLVPLFFGFVF